MINNVIFDILNKKMKDNDNYINLISRSSQIIQQAEREHKELLEFKSLFFGISELTKDFIWWKCWDCESKQHYYKYANKKFNDKFFGLYDLPFEEQLNYVQGKTDLFLLAKYRHDKNIKHSYGDLCVSTDIHCMRQGIKQIENGLKPYACNYVEMGVIGTKPLILDVQKIPLFDGQCSCPKCQEMHGYCGTMGIALNKTDFFSQIDLDQLVKEQKLEKLDECVYWLQPDTNFNWDKLKI